MRNLILFMALALSGCRLDDGTTDKVAQLQQAVAEQDKVLDSLKRTSEALKAELASVKMDTSFNTLMVNLQSESYTAVLSLTDRNYSIVQTGLGFFLLSVQDVTPFANGVKLKVDVGNPQAMTYSGLKFTVLWKKTGESNSPDQTKEIELPQRFVSGSWSRAELVISPAKVDEITNVRVSVSPNQVQLQAARP